MDSGKVEFLELQRFSVGDTPPLDITDISHVVEVTYHKRRGIVSDKPRFRENFEDVITALRLYKHGSVNFNVIAEESDLWQPASVKSYGYGKSDYKRPLGPKYALTSSEVKGFKHVFRKYTKFQQRNRKSPTEYLNIAIRRFNLGVSETEVEDKVIDFMISFEAMFLENQGELTFKLSNRIAILLGKTKDERKIIREIMKESYGWRGAIVHGKKKRELKIMKNSISEKDLVIKIEDLLRRSILGFIGLNEKNKSHETIVENLDFGLLDMKMMRELQRDAGTKS